MLPCFLLQAVRDLVAAVLKEKGQTGKITQSSPQVNLDYKSFFLSFYFFNSLEITAIPLLFSIDEKLRKFELLSACM